MSEKEWVMPTHIVAAAGIVLNENDEILMVNTYNAGWVFPGGQVEEGEDLLQGLRREILEETGIEAEIKEVFCISSNTCKHPGYNGVKEVPTKVMVDFICRKVGGEARSSEENSETGWFKRDEVLSMITVPAVAERFKAYLEYSGRPFFLSYVTRPKFVLALKTNI